MPESLLNAHGLEKPIWRGFSRTNFDMGLIGLLVRPPIEVDAGLVVLKFLGVLIGNGQHCFEELVWASIADPFGKHSEDVAPCQQRKVRAIPGKKKMVIACDTFLSHR